jgi:transposase-like protein
MNKTASYPEEFKIEAVKQITERGHKVAEVSARIGVSQHSLCQAVRVRYAFIKRTRRNTALAECARCFSSRSRPPAPAS